MNGLHLSAFGCTDTIEFCELGDDCDTITFESSGLSNNRLVFFTEKHERAAVADRLRAVAEALSPAAIPRVFVGVEGGVVQGWSTTERVEVNVLDHDAFDRCGCELDIATCSNHEPHDLPDYNRLVVEADACPVIMG